MRNHYLLPLLFFLASCHFLFGQSSQKKASLQDLKVDTDNIDPDGKKCIKLAFGVHFNYTNDVRKENMFILTWRVENAKGEIIYDSKNQEKYTNRQQRISPSNSFKDKKPPYMLDRFNYLYLPFELLKLSSGPQKLTVVLSLENEENETLQFPDFAREEIEFQYTKIEPKPFSDQVLTVEDIQFSHNKSGFAVKEPGLDISFRLRPKYGQKETETTSYTIYWLLRDMNGTVVFDSRQTASVHHRKGYVYFRNMDKGTFRRLTCFSRYNDIRLPGPGKVEVALFAQNKAEESKQIYIAVHELDLPVKYEFAQQNFEINDLKSSIATRKGVQGLRLDFDLQFGKYGPRLDPERGNYFIYPEVRDIGGNIIFSPQKLKDDRYNSALLTYSCDAYSKQEQEHVELFIPWHLLELPAGKTYLQYSLLASDQKREVKFPELSKGGCLAMAPTLRKYSVNLTELRMKDREYDVEFFKAGSHRPDLQWTLQAGRDDLYVSKQINNTLSAAKAMTSITVAEGDELSLVLYDIDSGIFNQNDWLGRWKIPFMDHPDSFVLEKDDDENLAKLQIEFSPMR